MLRLWKVLTLALAIVALGVSTIFIASCGSNGTSYRAINAIANYEYAQTGGFDFTMNGATVYTGVQFGNINPPGNDAYAKISSGSNVFDVYPHGEVQGNNGGTPVINSSLSFNGRTQYTVVLMGNNTTNDYVSQPFTDNNAVPSSGDFEFRVIHASNNMTSSVDVYIVGNPQMVTGPNPPPPNANVVYGQASAYQSNPAGTWWLVITAHGGHVPIVNPTSYTPSALQIRTIVLVDGPGGFGVGTPLIFSDLN